MNTEQLRADFEAWLREWKPDMSLKRYADGLYMVTTVNYAWEAYQAGRAALLTERDALREALAAILEHDSPINIVDTATATEREIFELARAALAQEEA